MEEEDAPNSSNQKKTVPPHVRAISASLGGIVMASCLQPLDVIKTRLQLDRPRNYRGMIHCGATISRTEGVRALWKGLTPFAAHLGLKFPFRIGSSALIQSAFDDSESGKFSVLWPHLSAFGAGVLETLVIVTPLEVVKIRLQKQRVLNPEVVKYKGPVHCAGMIIREEGLRGLWAGAAPTLMRNGVYQAAIITAKNAFDVMLWKKYEGDQRKTLNPWQSMLSGMLAVATGPICCHPFDVVKTRLMAQSEEGKYKGMMHAITTIYAEEGLLAFWRGMLPVLVWMPPSLVLMSAVSHQVDRLYQRNSHNSKSHWNSQ